MIANSSTNNYQNSRFIVATDLTVYPTIQSAINAAVLNGGNATIYIRPGTYTEDLTLSSTVNLEGVDNTLVTLIGTHTPPSSGTLTITRIGLESSTDILSSLDTGTTNIVFSLCRFKCGSGYAANLPAWSGLINFTYCTEHPDSISNGIVFNQESSIDHYCWYYNPKSHRHC
jgi:hypothetical protein